MFQRLFTLCLCGFFLCTTIATAAYAAAPIKKEVPTNITASRMDYDAQKQTVVFTGNVHVKRPDFELRAAQMTVYLKKSGKSTSDDSSMGGMGAGDIDRIVAQKNVLMTKEDKEGRCSVATFYADTETLVMEGAPVLKDKERVIKGKKIVHYMKTNKSEVHDGAEITFSAPDNTTSKQNLQAPDPKGQK